jgi:alanyl-tRNA synthetase
MRGVAAAFNNAPDILAALHKAMDENADLKRQAQEAMVERANNYATQLLNQAYVVNGVKLVVLKGTHIPEGVKLLAMAVRRDSPEGTAFIAATADTKNKPLLTVALTDDLVKAGLNAANIARTAAKAIKGGGGGQPGFAQAGGKDAEGLETAFNLLVAAFQQ